MWIQLIFLSVVIRLGVESVGSPPIKAQPAADKKEFVKVALLGQNIKLPCHMSGFPTPILSWTKNKKDIREYSWYRFKEGKRVLKISEVTKDDTGIYVCKGTNGFGSEEIRIDLIVIDPKEVPHLAEDEFVDVAPPVFTEETMAMDINYSKETGEGLTLSCEALGKPKPEVRWYRNRQEYIPDSGMNQRKGKATLELRNLMEADSGTFTCQATNKLATVTRNFTLKVSYPTHHPIMPSGPENTTVVQGKSAILECKVQSSSLPTIKWLKQLEEWDNLDNLEENEILNVLGKENKLQLIRTNSNDTKQRENNEYVNSLRIPEASLTDAGMYYCFAINPVGYKYKNAYLTVVPPDQETLENIPAGVESTTKPLMIIVICLAVFVFAFIILITVCIVRRRHKRPSSETPEVHENLMRQHHIQQQQQIKQNGSLLQKEPAHHPHQMIYQQQQYQAASLNNNRQNKMLEPTLPTPPPPPPPSLHNENTATSSQWGMYQPGSIMNMTTDSANTSSSYRTNNQYEVPHIHTMGKRGGAVPNSSHYYGSQQPIYPNYMGHHQYNGY